MPEYANLRAKANRWRGSRLERQPSLMSTVIDHLAMGWSPQQISNRLAKDQGCNVISHESIYRFIYAQIKRTKDYSWRQLLPRAKSRRGFRGRKGGSSVSFIKHRRSIHDRPQFIDKRSEPGHWEADLMLFAQQRQPLLVLQERYSRLLMLFKLETKSAKPIANQLIAFFNELPRHLGLSITFDNGTEFAEHHLLNQKGIDSYFCDVRAPWQKGGVENAIGRLRRFLPRKTNIKRINGEELEKLAALHNHTPRKCLGYQTPAEIFLKQVLHFKCELTFPLSRE